MIYSLKGKLIAKRENFFVVEVGGVGFKVFSSAKVVKSLQQIGAEVNVFTYLHVREDALELFGFLNPDELRMFELLNSISGIGPKSALGILSVDKMENLKAAIVEGRPELLTKASGVGQKTADRVILELRGKLKQEGAKELVGMMESDSDIVEALAGLGYTKNQAKQAVSKVGAKITKTEDRIKEAIKILKQ